MTQRLAHLSPSAQGGETPGGAGGGGLGAWPGHIRGRLRGILGEGSRPDYDDPRGTPWRNWLAVRSGPPRGSQHMFCRCCALMEEFFDISIC